MSMKKSRALYDVPRKGVFCGPDKYLKLQKFVVSERMFPIMEDDSFFLLVRNGKGHFTVNGIVFEVQTGDVCWIQCTHTITIEPDDSDGMEFWVCVFDYQLANYLMFRELTQTEKLSVVYTTPMLPAESQNGKEIKRLFLTFERINNSREYGTALMKVSLLGQMAVLFGQETDNYVQENLVEEWPVGFRGCMYIAAHSTEPITMESTAGALNTDVLTLNRELRMVTGQNFEQMLNRSRVIMAASYFLCENLPFDYIAACSGFKSEITFYRNFKKVMGRTPQAYREQFLNEGKNGEIYRGMAMDEMLVSVIDYLYTNISEPINLEGMAKSLYTSSSIIRSLLDRAFGIGYKEVLSLFRIRYSESLLATMDLPILDISVMVGFNSARTYSRVFSEINGMSPSEYRQLCQSERRMFSEQGSNR